MKNECDNFTIQAKHIITLAIRKARRLNCTSVDTEHILLALVADEGTTAAKLLTQSGLRLSGLREAVEFTIGARESVEGGWIGLTSRARRVIELAQLEACRLDSSYCRPEHFLLALLREREGLAAIILETLGGARLYAKFRDALQSKCPRCNAKVTTAMIDYPLASKGKVVILRNVPAQVCSQCGEPVEVQLDSELKEKVRRLVESGLVPRGTVEVPVYYVADIH